MKNFSESLIKNYVEGNDLTGYDIDFLEDNCQFMQEVINYTGDLKMYHFASQRLKKDGNFVKFLITKFSSDAKFICQVMDYYLSFASPCDVLALENLIRISKILSENEEYLAKKVKYQVKIEAIYEIEQRKLNKQKSTLNKNDLGENFISRFNKYNCSEVVMNFFANRIINELIKENYPNLEEIIHKKYMTLENFKQIDKNNFILELIKPYDASLASYIELHPAVLEDILEKINQITKRFTFFNHQEYKAKLELILEKMAEYFEDDIYDYQMLSAVMKETKVLENASDLGTYAYIFDKEFYDNELEDLGGLDTYKKHLSDEEKENFQNLTKMIYEILNPEQISLTNPYVNKVVR